VSSLLTEHDTGHQFTYNGAAWKQLQAVVEPSVANVTTFDSDGDNTAQAGNTAPVVLYGLEVSNPNAADAYIQLFDLATGSVTVGSTAPKLSFLVPGGDGTLDGGIDMLFSHGVDFATALTYACTTTATGNTDPSTGLVVNLWMQLRTH
jgi:hypothetical protein